MSRMTKIIVGLCAVLFLTGGTVAVAGGALPGSMLYGIKLGVNEKVSAAFAGGGRSKVDWQIAAAERRLREASEASLKGQFDTEAQTVVLANFNTQLKGIDEYLTMLKEENRLDEAKEVAIKVGQALANQAESLAYAQAEAHTSTTGEGEQGALDFLMLKVTGTLAAAANIAASTLVEDPLPEGTSDGRETDEWGRPLKANVDANVEATGSVDAAF